MLQNEAGASAVPVPRSRPADASARAGQPAAAAGPGCRALSADDRAALGLWAAAHLALLALAWASAWAFRATARTLR